MFVANVLVFVGLALATLVFLPIEPAWTLAGFFGFGGGAAYLAFMHRVVQRQTWAPAPREVESVRVYPHRPPPTPPVASEPFIQP